ncbi:MAG: cell division protein ZapB [Edaphobacter sp.]|uniref:cell division protein ZapB n=1 Tax=Edaphobacter sp. TaxID=1934404 RepID=UPI0023881438|nr:cell division protein ZapB [Edaphobacter sp.]MDE1176532.1 cell division protein ZapB [Edaphobacter sp.]
MSTAQVSVDEFQALEQKVHRAVEIVRQERETRARLEAEITNLKEQLEFQTLVASEAQAAVNTLSKDRESVKHRVEKMLEQMDELL